MATTGAIPLAFSGPLTWAEVPKLHDEMRLALAMGRNLEIDLRNVGPVDVAGLQLLISTVASARRRGRTARIVHAPASFTSTVERAGLSDWWAGAAGGR